MSSVSVPNSIWWELERRLVLIYLGKSHISSQVHGKVIKELENSDPDNPKLNDLRSMAKRSVNAIYSGDFNELGKTMIDNTEAQGRLHPELVGPDAKKIIEIAKKFGVVGYKVNGAGGGGGSVTLLAGPVSSVKRAMIKAIEQENPYYKNIPVYLSRTGLRVWEKESH